MYVVVIQYEFSKKAFTLYVPRCRGGKQLSKLKPSITYNTISEHITIEQFGYERTGGSHIQVVLLSRDLFIVEIEWRYGLI